MDKKKKQLLLIVIAALVVGIAALVISGLTPAVGYVIAADNGQYLIVLDDSPVVMGNCTRDENLFVGLKTGNQVLILHDGIRESYPAQTGVYFCMNIGSGDPDKIPAHIMESLTELGWITP